MSVLCNQELILLNTAFLNFFSFLPMLLTSQPSLRHHCFLTRNVKIEIIYVLTSFIMKSRLRNGRNDEGAAHLQVETQQLTNLSSSFSTASHYLWKPQPLIWAEQKQQSEIQFQGSVHMVVLDHLAFNFSWVCPEVSSSSPQLGKPRKTKALD